MTTALATVAGDRGGIGVFGAAADGDRAEPAVDSANLTSALSNIQDANVAQTYAKYTKETVLQQAGVQVLKQADQTPSQLLALFQ